VAALPIRRVGELYVLEARRRGRMLVLDETHLAFDENDNPVLVSVSRTT